MDQKRKQKSKLCDPSDQEICFPLKQTKLQALSNFSTFKPPR